MKFIAITLVQAEYVRQIDGEGFNAAHDDEHTDGSLASAAACYASPFRPETDLPSTWPWASEWWKPTPDDRIRELVKAGALICAEIDRLLRVEDAKANERVAQRETFLVRSGPGFVCDRGTLAMTSDSSDALRFNVSEAENVARILQARSLHADVVDDLLSPARMPARDEQGFACHEDIFMPEWYDGDPADEAPFIPERLRIAGWEIIEIEMDGDLLEDDQGDLLQDDARDAAVARWQPEPPVPRDGPPWQLVAVFDTEDGPQASFVRRRSNEGESAL